MVSFHLVDVPTQHDTPAPSVIQPLSPSSPSSPLLPHPASLGSHTEATFPLFPQPLASSSATTVSLSIDATTFGYLLVAAFGACLICGSTFQWVTEKGLFRRTLIEKANQYNVIVAVTALATLLQTLACFVDALITVEGPVKLIVTILILISWIMMTHGSVMIVARKLSLTYNNSAENAWQRLLYINAGMMIPTILVGITWVGTRYDYHNEDMMYVEMYRYLGPIELVLWGLLELILSGLFIIQMRKYHWDEVERKGVLTLTVVALCDTGLICMNIVLMLLRHDDDDIHQTIVIVSASTACVRGFVYALRIRLELNVLSSMVSYIQKKRKQVFYQAIEERKKRRRAMLKMKLKRSSGGGKRSTGGGSSSGADLMDDDDDDQDDTDASGTNRSGTDSIFKRFQSSSSEWRRRRRRQRRRRKNDDNNNRIDDFDNDDNDDSSNHSIFKMLRRRKNRRSKSRTSDQKAFDNHNDSDASTSSQMSIFHRLPHATDFSNIFQRNFLEDFAIATQQSGNLFSNSLQSLGKKCRDIAKNATDNLSVASGRSFGSGKKKKRRGMGSSTLRTQATVRNSTSSCEIPIQGMEIKLTQPSVPESKEYSESLHDDYEMDLEAATSGNKAGGGGKVPRSNTYHYASSVSDLDIGLSSSDDDDDSDDSSDDDSDVHDIDHHDIESTTEDTRHAREDDEQLQVLKTPFKQQQSQQSLIDDSDDEDDDDERSAGMMFGIPRSSFRIKTHPNYSDFDLIGVDDSGEEEAKAQGIDRTTATSTSPPTTAAIAEAATTAATTTSSSNGQQQEDVEALRLPSFRRCISLNNQKLPPLRRSRTLRESRLARIGMQDKLRREDSIKDDCSVELQRAFDQLESMDCL